MSKKITLMSYLTPLSAQSHPELHEALADLCRKAGLETPLIHAVDPLKLESDFASQMLEAMPVGTFHHAGKHHVFMNEEAMETLGLGKLTGRTSEEIKAIIAHELGHIKRGDAAGFGIARVASYTPYACLIAGLAVTKYLHYRHEHPHAEPEQPKDASMLLEQTHSPTISGASAFGHYLLAGVAATGAGIFAAKHMRHHMEYACDAFSKELMGTGTPLISAFEKMDKAQSAMIQGMIDKGKITPEKAEKIKVFAGMLESLFHPSAEKRISALR